MDVSEMESNPNIENKWPVLFLNDWPRQATLKELNSSPNYQFEANTRDSPAQLDHELSGLSDIKRWRLQILLAVNPWGIPSLALVEAYKRKFGQKLNVQELGFEHLYDMVCTLSDIFTIQEPDEVTALLFPDYSQDKILHDARLGHNFERPNLDASNTNGTIYSTALSTGPVTTTTSVGGCGGGGGFSSGAGGSCSCSCGSSSNSCSCCCGGGSGSSSSSSKSSGCCGSTASCNNSNNFNTFASDINELIAQAWLNRDDEFPNDVVLLGEQYPELIMPMTSANIDGTRGLHQAVIVSCASPNHFHINIKSDAIDRIAKLNLLVTQYFKDSELPIEAYSVPAEFVRPGFPCLVYNEDQSCWERCSIVGWTPKAEKVVVETIDYGGTLTVNLIYLYLVPRVFFNIPKQGLPVSLAGVKPAGKAEKWASRASTRLRCFSIRNYWLDCLLLEPKVVTSANNSNCDSIDDRSISECASNCSKTDSYNRFVGQSHKRRRPSYTREAEYEVILCDRNDPNIDLYLNEILILETYAMADEQRSREIDSLKDKLVGVFKDLPRPTNPLITNVNDV